uniref:ribosomal protein L28 n=1 Tax=Polyopes affinis TaxID=194519 RepID=UPI002A804149|nr:ribosomal protein L28 [Polyopes affinis]WOL37131.1 ribosomal protein L28 [Polyopes affinis]
MAKVCKVTNKKANNAYSVSHSHVRTKKIQNVNLHTKKIWSITQDKWVRLKVSTRAIKSLHKLKI